MDGDCITVNTAPTSKRLLRDAAILPNKKVCARHPLSPAVSDRLSEYATPEQLVEREEEIQSLIEQRDVALKAELHAKYKITELQSKLNLAQKEINQKDDAEKSTWSKKVQVSQALSECIDILGIIAGNLISGIDLIDPGIVQVEVREAMLDIRKCELPKLREQFRGLGVVLCRMIQDILSQSKQSSDDFCRITALEAEKHNLQAEKQALESRLQKSKEETRALADELQTAKENQVTIKKQEEMIESIGKRLRVAETSCNQARQDLTKYEQEERMIRRQRDALAAALSKANESLALAHAKRADVVEQ